MTREEAIEILRGILTEAIEFENSVCYVTGEDREPLEMTIETLESIKTMGEEMRKFREGIKDENVLIGFNMAIAICNKYLGETNETDN